MSVVFKFLNMILLKKPKILNLITRNQLRRNWKMNELDFVNAFIEIIKKSIDNNLNYTEWEKAYKKAYEDELKEFAKQFYEQQKSFRK